MEVFNKTGEDVLNASSGKQHPELSLRFFAAANTFLGSRPVAAVPTPAPPAPTPAPVQSVLITNHYIPVFDR